MHASFEEKSVWAQLVSMMLVFGSYLVAATYMMSTGMTKIADFIPLFSVTVGILVVVQIISHIVIAFTTKPEGRDERDRIIQWRSENNSSWILAVGIVASIISLVVSDSDVLTAHILLFSLFSSTIVKYLVQLIYYRKGMAL